MKNIVILALVVSVVWLFATVLRLENYRYAGIVGICEEIDGEVMKPRSARHECLNNISTRTHFIWHRLKEKIDSLMGQIRHTGPHSKLTNGEQLEG